MQAVFEKIIEKLEKLSDECYKAYCIGFNSDDRAEYDAYTNAIEIVKQEAVEYNNGWIPCSERLPETNESVLCWAKSTARGGDVCFVGSCHNGFWFLQSSADTHSLPGQYVIVAWQSIEPYKQIG